ncbi:Peptidoglycan/LPS O-acetylase OafA/YrhL, contains acyltransferase and SGNH-hydrolase domains [Kytococcus aerolatus]|uniref:Peptidoglycan/LPS O-acetylase OafA/YrhL, contains acyltransferase and SGNH-hydrolase domains n=1 Tax=Kytococcus aerolatus TaxID=592308 RepID=A0A212T410_9MICO|nr:acyltransferase family protein [Kytococcus aerolatus]SNC60514.1 Peptidoglycan/LPS O-acetylase OafA/YrhL, contains acyltransferase and SGNH-hydrolase domains [Kytococcus aerolatus]
MSRRTRVSREGHPDTTPVAGFGSGSADSGRIRGLDGLRALAVVLVLVFHFAPSHLPGGFIGVDVFFVISGFLITTLLLREVRRNGYMNMTTFWLRRIRRLLPALVVLLVVCTALVLVVDLWRGGDLRVGLGRQILGGLTFTTNWVEILHGTSYFDQNQPVLYKTLWSLSVEEQFYLFWPIMLALILVTCRRWRTRGVAVAVLGVLSALWMGVLYFRADDVTRPYYGTDSHLFGLMLGVLVSFWWMSRNSWLRSERWNVLRLPVALGGLVLLVLLSAVMPADRAVTYLGGLFLASLVSAALVAAVIPGHTALHRVLELPAVEWVGERSYGIYLWHWPLLLLAQAALPAQAEGSVGFWLLRALVLVVTLVAVELSYQHVEKPIRKLGVRQWAQGLLQRGRRERTVGPVRLAAGAGLVGALMGTAAVATAPEKTEVQQSIEANEQMLAEQDLPTVPATPSAEPTSGGSSSGATGEAPSGAPSGSGGKGSAEGRGKTSGTGSSGSAGAGPSGSSSSSAGQSPSGSSSAPSRESAKGGDWSVPAGDQLSVFGDSLVVTSAHGVQGTFPGVLIDARSNRQWIDGRAVVKAHVDAGSVRDSVVLSFGTNAGIPDRQVVRDTIEMLGPDRQVVLVNLYGKSSWIGDANNALQQIADEYPNVEVADWHGAIKSRPDLLQSDGVHPGIEGGKLYAETVRQTFEGRAGG